MVTVRDGTGMTENLIGLSTGATVAVTDVGSAPRSSSCTASACRAILRAQHRCACGGHRVVALDFRGQARRRRARGATASRRYAARRPRASSSISQLDDAVLLGWSMGSLVAWEYQRQFAAAPPAGRRRIISQGPSDLTQPDWPNGMVAPLELGTYLEAAQTDFRGFFAEFVPAMFKTQPTAAEQEAMVDAICGIDPNAGAVILADQTLRDLRPVIPTLELPPSARVGDRRGRHQAGVGHLARAAPPVGRAARVRGQRPLPDVGGARALQRARRGVGRPGSAAEQARHRLVVLRDVHEEGVVPPRRGHLDVARARRPARAARRRCGASARCRSASRCRRRRARKRVRRRPGDRSANGSK